MDNQGLEFLLEDPTIVKSPPKPAIVSLRKTNLPYHSIYSTFEKRFWEMFRGAHPKIDGRDILDLGCNDGTVTEEICQAYPHAGVIGIDINEAAIKIAKMRNGNAQYFLDDGYRSAFPAESFDAVFCNNNVYYALSYMKDNEAREALTGIGRLVKPNGILIISGGLPVDYIILKKQNGSFMPIDILFSPNKMPQFILDMILKAFGLQKDRFISPLLELPYSARHY